MGIIKEPKDVDFIIKSEPWTDKELEDFRKLMKEQKAKNAQKKFRATIKRTKKHYA